MSSTNPPGKRRPTHGYPDAPPSSRSRETSEHQRQKAISQSPKIPGWAVGLGVALVVIGLFLVFRPAAAPLQTVKSSVQSQPVAAAPVQEAVAEVNVVENAPAAPRVQMIDESQPKKLSPAPVFPVNGSVTLNGQKASGAFVVFHPLGEPLPRNAKPYAQVKQDGSFEMTTFTARDGAPPGDYAVTIQWKPVEQDGAEQTATHNVMPKRLAKPETSGIKVTVIAGENRLPEFQLTN